MQKTELISKVEDFVKSKQKEYDTAHDFSHVDRVRGLASKIGKIIGANPLIVELASLLHDVDDYKYSGDEDAGREAAQGLLTELGVSPDVIEKVTDIVFNIGYKNDLKNEKRSYSLEFAAVRDADRLEAMGGFGIARCHITASKRGNLIHDPRVTPRIGITKEEYMSDEKSTAFNHFLEKLLLLKETMLTKPGKDLAIMRHRRLELHMQALQEEYEDSSLAHDLAFHGYFSKTDNDGKKMQAPLGGHKTLGASMTHLTSLENLIGENTTRIVAQRSRIESLAGLEKTSKAETVFLAFNNIRGFREVDSSISGIGILDLSGNPITSLENCPVVRELNVCCTYLKNLIGAPEGIEIIRCGRTSHFTSLEGCPRSVKIVECANSPHLVRFPEDIPKEAKFLCY